MKKRLLLLGIVSVAYAEETVKLEKLTTSYEYTPYIENIPAELINITNKSDIGNALSNITPTINHIRKGGTFSDVVLRGFYRDNINVLVDDAKIFGACPNRMDPPISKVSSMEIKEVKVEKGAFDIQHQGSMAGLVQVETKDPSSVEKLDISFTVGSFSYTRGNVLFTGGNEKLSVLLGYEKNYSKPYKTGEGKRFTEYKHPNPMNDYQPKYYNKTAYDIDNIITGVKYTPDKENEFIAKFGYQAAESVLYPYLKMDTVYDDTYKTSLKYTQKELKVSLNLYFNRTYHDMQDKWRVSAIPWTDGTNSTRGYMMRTVAKTRVYGFSLKKEWQIAKLNITSGIDGYVRNWRADNVIMTLENSGMIPDVYIKNVGAFTEFKRKFDKNLLKAGVRLDYTYSKANEDALSATNKTLYAEYYQSNYSLSKSDTYLSGFVSDELSITDNFSVFAGIGHTVRVPDPQERYIALRKPMTNPDWVGNPNLRPSKNTEVDVRAKYKNGRFKIEAGTYYSYVSDYVYLTTITGTKQALSYTNIDAYFYGFDFDSFFTIYENIGAEFSGAYQAGKKVAGKDKDIAEMPPFKLRFALMYDDMKKFAKLEAIHAFRQNKVDSTLNESPTPSYTVFNIKAGVNLKNVSLTAGVDNVFDKNYYTHLSYLRDPFSAGMKVPEPGRFMYVDLSVRF